MGRNMKNLKCAVAAFILTMSAASSVGAQQGDLDDLFAALRDADEMTAPPIVDKIWAEWSKSGSPAMDFLLKRGRETMEAEDFAAAVEHFSALIDHAPGFAEGYNARATAFYRLGRYGPAMSDIRAALALNPRHFSAMSGLASIQEELGYDVAALATWRRVLDLNPHQQNAVDAVARLRVRAEGIEI